jgi:hypothetical protein
MTNQAAFLSDERRPGPIWIEDLPPVLARRGNRPDQQGAYRVTVDELLQSGGFCHLNTLIVRRTLYDTIGGMEEAIRWEEDRDLYLRLIDRAIVIKYAPFTVARHNIPDPAGSGSMTTALSDFQRHLFRLMVFDRALHLASHPSIRAHAHRHKAYTLKRISEALDTAGRPIEAALYAREALGTGPTAKWTAYTAWLTLRATVKSRDQVLPRRNPKPVDQSLSSWRRWYFGQVGGQAQLPSPAIQDHPPSDSG